ncbi:MAG: tetratricopeptide repeat protein [candidate division KSB1 bacterium]|nr:tetratricopeptide repeat protein [candidate division KSB1 bacterium]MDZ7273860.1 tetratricopeptide repeat protein [candidate division KSB1 bacterium]MDZ7286016.1 tetratricopeptide repeat protein [candidate division KSB1 bacterium]MDZ7299048.1 tetratricopeptide repeat protein [candidate division KSB1 bacterium]MDZ7308814.1 tetratricopeptide repeat protein [candidate division KSB1 bacterium]
METTRLEKLLRSLNNDPADAFTRYLVALELTKLNRTQEALTHFERLVAEHPDYVPTYYQYARLLEGLNRIPEAIAIYRAGLQAARGAGNHHAASELQAALDLLE